MAERRRKRKAGRGGGLDEAEPTSRSAAPRRVWLLVAALAAAALAAYLGSTRELDALAGPLVVRWWLLAPFFFAAETYAVHLHFRREAHSFTLSEVPLVIGLFFADPTELVLARVVGSALALVVGRQRSAKLAFNLALFALEATVAAAVFSRFVDRADPPGLAGSVAAFAAAAATSSLGVGAIFAAVWMTEGRPSRRELARSLAVANLVTFANTSLALVGVGTMWRDPGSAWLLVAPALVLLAAYRAYSAQRRRHEALAALHEAGRALQRAGDLDAAVGTLLSQARLMLRAERAELTLFPGGPGSLALVARLGPDERLETEAAADPAAAFGGVWATAAEGAVVLRPRGRRPGPPALPGRPDVRDAVVVPLRGETRVVGGLLVADRLGDVATFDDDDRRLLESLADLAGVSLENDRLHVALAEVTQLKEQLAHQAFHDPLTGWANRVLFGDRVEHALARRGARDASVAVVFVDLDDFKNVNDSLGHHAGDSLLVEVTRRLAACLRPADTAARLGGDEFAFLVEDVVGPADAVAVAARLLDALAPPFPLLDHEVLVRGSAGVAVSGPGSDADELLRNADVAMYRAKAHGKGRTELFEPGMHERLLERLEMRAALERALDRREFVVHYQPTVSLTTGEVVGVEALVRWRHPERGLLRPDAFIPVAEDTGVVVALGRFVLEEACRQARHWQRARPGEPPLSVSVNLSPRQVHHPGLVDDVAAALRAAGLAPSCLVLEITERLMVADTAAVVARLDELKDLGVRLAIDDFGTGYSSLAYLQRLPVDVVKIDKSFVGADGGPKRMPLVRAVVELARELDLQTVAEGVERHEQLVELTRLGCQVAQGYYFASPMAAASLEALLWAEGASLPWCPVRPSPPGATARPSASVASVAPAERRPA